MPKKIRIFIHSYKNKEIGKVCSDILESSKNDVEIYLFDKKNVPISLKNDFIHNNSKIKYNHIKWENRRLEVSRRSTLLWGEFDYFLSVSDNVVLPQDWDETCINIAENNNVVSGSGKAKLDLGTFFLEESYDDIGHSVESFWVDKDFIFVPRAISPMLAHKYKVVPYLDSIILTLNFYNDGVSILSLPKNFYTKKEKKENYSQLSKYHGNNTLIKDIKDGKFNIDDFNAFHGLSLQDLNFLPFETDHVHYERFNSDIVTEKGGRFHGDVLRITT